MTTDAELCWYGMKGRVMAKDKNQSRSTPLKYQDFAQVIDSRGKKWRYSKPTDTWGLVISEVEGIAPHSHRSWQKLQHEFGPLKG